MSRLDYSHPSVMAILNITPDSFSDGGRFFESGKAIAQAKKMAAEGADIIDIGGESTRPGSEPVSEEEELRRVLPAIKALVKEIKVPISIDSYKPNVVEQCLEAGASIANDVTGLRNPEMIKVVAQRNVPVVIMHMLGKPKTMQENPVYADVVGDIKSFFQDRIAAAKKAGIRDIILDPGIGFGKTLEHNLQILKRLHEFTDLGYPVLVGPSRKSFIGKITGLDVNERLEGTLAAVAIAVYNGASIVRVHDVREAKQVVLVAEALKKG